ETSECGSRTGWRSRQPGSACSVAGTCGWLRSRRCPAHRWSGSGCTRCSVTCPSGAAALPAPLRGGAGGNPAARPRHHPGGPYRATRRTAEPAGHTDPGGIMRQRRIFAVLVAIAVGGWLIWYLSTDHSPAAAPQTALTQPTTTSASPQAPTSQAPSSEVPSSQTPSPSVSRSEGSTSQTGAMPNVVGMRLSRALALRGGGGVGWAKGGEGAAGARLVTGKPVGAAGGDGAVPTPQTGIARAQDPPAGRPASPSTPVTLRVDKPSDSASTGEAAPGPVPRV